MSKHTPGPWHVEVTLSAINVDSDMGGIAQVFGADNPDDETMPNARLLAKSPELYDLLKQVRTAWMNGRMDTVEGILTGDVLAETLEEIEA